MDVLAPLAAAEAARIVLGVNVDDLGDHRPGQRAAREAGASFPLVTAGFTKREVREASRHLGLRTWDKPAAACLASRVPYGTEVTVAVLSQRRAGRGGAARPRAGAGPGPPLRRHGPHRGRAGRPGHGARPARGGRRRRARRRLPLRHARPRGLPVRQPQRLSHAATRKGVSSAATGIKRLSGRRCDCPRSMT